MPTFTRIGLHERPVYWQQYVVPLRGATDGPLHLLEIGVYDGRSACWWLDNLLTGPYDRYVGIDPFDKSLMQHPRRMSGIEDRARANLATYGAKATIIKAKSQDVLTANSLYAHLIPSWRFDVVYIDGDHELPGVMDDTVAVWPLVKTGGIVIWDDYIGGKRYGPRRFQIRDAIAPFLLNHPHEVLWVSRQLGVLKVS